MSMPSRRERLALARELKSFAFDESPLFRQNQVQRMRVERSFEIIEPWGESLGRHVSEQLDCDATEIEIGFRATREVIGYGEKPEYLFDAWWSTSRLVHPRQLVLPPEDWHHLMGEYDDEVDDEELSGELAVDSSDVVELLIDDDVLCEQFARREYKFDTSDGGIQFCDERGFLVGGDVYGSNETHFIDMPAPSDLRSSTILIDETADDIGDKIATQLLFDEITLELRADYADNGDIMPHSDKARELLFLVNCLKKRTIAL